jgi:hypothetical protein
MVAKIPTTNQYPYGQLNPMCLLEEDNSITVKFDTKCCFDYDVYTNGTPKQRIDGACYVTTTTAKLTGLSPNQTYDIKFDILDKCGAVQDTKSHPCRTTCILPGATVLTPNGKKLIDDIRSGDIVVDEYGNHVKVINNIRSGASKKKVITFKKGSFGIRKPNANLSITSNHPIKRLGNEVLVENCVNNHSIKSRYMMVDHTFTLLTNERCFVITNGIPVATYSQVDFEKQCERMSARGSPLLYRLL